MYRVQVPLHIRSSSKSYNCVRSISFCQSNLVGHILLGHLGQLITRHEELAAGLIALAPLLASFTANYSVSCGKLLNARATYLEARRLVAKQ
jgi:hypothetical protein